MRLAAVHGFTGIADFQVMDEAGSLAPVEGGSRLAEDLAGAAQDAFLESMADACRAVLAAQPDMLSVNVMNDLRRGR